MPSNDGVQYRYGEQPKKILPRETSVRYKESVDTLESVLAIFSRCCGAKGNALGTHDRSDHDETCPLSEQKLAQNLTILTESKHMFEKPITLPEIKKKIAESAKNSAASRLAPLHMRLHDGMVLPDDYDGEFFPRVDAISMNQVDRRLRQFAHTESYEVIPFEHMIYIMYQCHKRIVSEFGAQVITINHHLDDRRAEHYVIVCFNCLESAARFRQEFDGHPKLPD